MYRYIGHFLNALSADVIFKELFDELPWERRPDAPRMEYWTNDFDRPYTYGQGRGIRTYNAKPPHPHVIAIRKMLNDVLFCDFEGCFVNGYTGERDWLGWHADNDPGIDHTKPIAVVSIGQARNIQVRANDKTGLQTFMLDPGSIFVMPAGSQFTHKHQIPKVGHKVGPRISLTFRGLVAIN